MNDDGKKEDRNLSTKNAVFIDPIDSGEESLDEWTKERNRSWTRGLGQLPRRNLVSRISSQGDWPEDELATPSPMEEDKSMDETPMVEAEEVFNFSVTARKGSSSQASLLFPSRMWPVPQFPKW